MESTYNLTGKYMQGVSLMGLEITDDNGSKKLLRMSDIYKLIEEGAICGCRLIRDGENIYIKSEFHKLSELPLITRNNTVQKLEATGKVCKGPETIGYTATDEHGRIFKLSKDKVWDIARQGGFTNISASVWKKTKILHGVGIELKDLPKFEV